MMNPWLLFSILFFGIWLVLFIVRKDLRKEMLITSAWTMPFGLTEPLFVPEYWTPPSLFDLAVRTGFDIESLIFCFAIGGVGAILYETVVKRKHEKMTAKERHQKRHRFHLLYLSSPLLVFVPLHIFTSLNPIYSASIAMFAGGIAAMICRPDLMKKVIVGGAMFLGVYFIYFLAFTLSYPGIVRRVWNLQALSGILVAGIPIEELLFAFTFGMLWSSVYEHAGWYRLAPK